MIIREFERQVERCAERPAVITEEKRLTYRELARCADATAHSLLSHDNTSSKPGTRQKGQVVGLLFEHGVDMIVGVLGTLKAGKAYVPLDITYPDNRLAYMLENSQASLVLTNSKTQSMAERLVQKLTQPINVMNIESVDMSSGSAAKSQRDCRGDRMAYILYTSGSTGKPKGVVQTHENVCYYIRNWTERFSITSADRMTLFSAFSHDGAGQDMFGALHNGAALYPYNILSRTNIAELGQWLQEEKITIWHSVPTLYRYFVDSLANQQTGAPHFPDLRFILLGGEQIRAHDIHRFKRFFPHSRLVNVYGQTESSVNSTWIIQPQDPVNKMLIGKPLDQTEILVVDEEGAVVEGLGTGEIIVACRHLAPGYWRDQEGSEAVFFHDPEAGPLYRTGDLGRLLADGDIECLGRKDSQVKIRGFRVEVGEIETALLRRPGIKEAAVVARSDETGYTHLYAYYVPGPSSSTPGRPPQASLTVSELRRYLSAQLPEYMIPSYFVELAQLPLTPNGKVDRKQLPQPEPGRPKLGVTYVAPGTDSERQISAIWQEILQLDQVGRDDNFFDLGGTSFDILKITRRFYEEFKREVPVVSLFRYPTIKALAEYLQQGEGSGVAVKKSPRSSPAADSSFTPVAVIGMAGRFPGARSIAEFWQNLTMGLETISFFSEEELGQQGVEPQWLEDPNYVKAYGVLADIDYFDAAFFHYSPAEAEMMDPQLRLLHEGSWEALENAGYSPEDYEGLIGIYAGNTPNPYWIALTRLNQGDTLDTSFLNSNYSTKVSYKLNLKGPSVIVQTACSTSLVALHFACQGLNRGECDLALAGGVSVKIPARQGYLYREGNLLSRDGHCRTFSANAAGTSFGSGVGMVVLKRLADAIAHGDTIDAVIKGTAINNDGSRKVGPTAPSVEGQAEVIAAARQVAGVGPGDITYLEAHGTGTLLGDPVELEALKLAFAGEKKGSCAIGSVKTNVGHLNSAAGAAGLIKTVMALKTRTLPPSLHFDVPNPGIDFDHSPFYVNTQLKEWRRRHPDQPLHAGVSSFGIGGTNAHVVLTEAPGGTREGIPGQVLVLLSARTPSALETVTRTFIDYMNANPDIPLEDAAYTLQVGRRAFKYRRLSLCARDDGFSRLAASRPSAVREGKKPVIFMFPGLGAQEVNMGWELYRTFPPFREEMDRCFDILKPLLDYDLKKILYNRSDESDESDMSEVSDRSDRSNKSDKSDRSNPSDRPDLSDFEVAQLAVFMVEYALANGLMALGIRPYALVGYSFGEYTAACLAGVLSLEQALKLVVLRGRLIKTLPGGGMLSVPAAAAEIGPLLAESGGLSLAVDNGSSCIVSGPTPAIEAFEQRMKEKRYICMRLNALHALHSTMMAPAAGPLAAALQDFTWHQPVIPYISNVTGTWITVEDAADPGYWVTHLQQTVRFADGIGELSKIAGTVFIEVGPGRDLSTLIKRTTAGEPERYAVDLMGVRGQGSGDRGYFLTRIGQLWRHGLSVDWSALHRGEKRQRVHLPTYPFERERYWLEGDPLKMAVARAAKKAPAGKNPDMAEWFYVPSWKRLKPWGEKPAAGVPGGVIIFIDSYGLGLQIEKELRRSNPQAPVITVAAAGEFCRVSASHYTLEPETVSDYGLLFQELQALGPIPQKILHLWNVTRDPETNWAENTMIDRTQVFGFYGLIYLVQAIKQRKMNLPLAIDVVTTNVHEVTGNEVLSPGKATVLGPVKVIPQEHPEIKCRHIDILLPEPGSPEAGELTRQLLREMASPGPDTVIAYRNNHRWVQGFEPVKLENAFTAETPGMLKQGGVYLITGGLGRMGLTLARYLARQVKAKLVLIGRSPLPPREEWRQWLDRHDEDEPVSRKILQVKELEALGAEVLVLSADVGMAGQMKGAVITAEQRFGALDGVIHAAGLIREKSFLCPVEQVNKKEYQQQLAAKVYGLLVLQQVLQGKDLDFCLLTSSLASILGGLGLSAYAAVNLFMDAFAQKLSRGSRFPWISVNWDFWRFKENETPKENTGMPGATAAAGAMTPEEGIKIFAAILAAGGSGQVAVSSGDLQQRIRQWLHFEFQPRQEFGEKEKPRHLLHPRPDLFTPYVPPASEAQRALARIWQTMFAIEKIGIDDNFFELGGDSLKAIAFTGRIHQELNTEVPLTVFFNQPTIKELARYIEENSGGQRFYSIPLAEKKEYYPLSSVQKRLYILQHIEPESTGYNLTSALELEGDIEVGRLEKVIRAMIKKHESLRTSCHMIDGRLVQRVHDEVAFEIGYKALEGDGGELADFIRPFDLSRAPLMRVVLIKQGKTRHILLLDMHHSIYDGISLQLFFSSFAVVYGGVELPGLRIQYKDYAEWQHRQLGTEILKRQEAYWLKVFSGEAPVLQLPLDFLRPSLQSFEGNRWKFTIEEPGTRALKTVGKEQGVTLFMVILAAIDVLLMKLSGQEDIVVGTPVAGRQHPDLENLIGVFVGTLALRNHPARGKTVTEFLREVKANTLAAFDNQNYPFEDLVEKLDLKRDTGRNPLFDVMFILHNYEQAAGGIHGLETEGLTITKYEYDPGKTAFDISFNVVEANGKLSFVVEYCRKLFKKETMVRFCGYLRQIVSSLPQVLEGKLAELDIISPDEKQQLLVEFNNTETVYPHHKRLDQLFAEQAARTPDHIALVGKGEGWKGRSGGIQLSYRELHEKSDRLAWRLGEKGVVPGTIVGIMVERSVEMMPGLLGIVKTGGAYLPLDPGYPGARINYILEQSGASLLLTREHLSGKVKSLAFAGEVIDMKEESPRRQYQEEQLTSKNGCKPGLFPWAPVYVIYTSGSTGNPKGIMVRHGNVANFIKGMTAIIDFSPGKTILALTTIAFDIFFLETILPLTRGLKVVLADEAHQNDPRLLGKLIRCHQVNMLQFTPSRLQLLINLAGDVDCLAGVKELIVGGEAFPVHLFERVREKFPGKIYNVYGPTETTIWSTVKDLTGCKGEELTIGSPIANTRVYIVNESLGPQPVGVAGELLIGGDGVAGGYLNNPELTGERFVFLGNRSYKSYRTYISKNKAPSSHLTPNTNTNTNTLYKTGDLARWLPEGEIQFLGRVDQQVKLRGYRIELGEIENPLSGHEAIREAVVLLKEGKDLESSYLCAYIVSEPGQALNVTQLREYLGLGLPDYMIPSYFIRVEQIPFTPNGKVDRKALQQVEFEGDRLKPGTAYTASGTHREKTVAQLWKEILKLEQVGLDDNFFDLGGNSTNILQLHARLSEVLAGDIPVVSMFRYPTINSFLRYLDNETAGDAVTDEEIDETVNLMDETTGLWESTLEE